MYRTARYSPAGIECDVSEPDNAERFLEEAHRGLGHVDVVVNAAGGSFQRLLPAHHAGHRPADLTDEQQQQWWQQQQQQQQRWRRRPQQQQ